jgi:hypothetical protein
MDFTIKSDVEFYCYLKACLPAGYTIVAEPSTAYYSEWQYHYRIFHGSELIRELKGDFHSLEKGLLVREAGRIMNDVGGRTC